jgi:hypothetical protein
MRVRMVGLAIVALIAAGGVLQLETAVASASPARVTSSAMAETLAANPGSVRLGEHTVLLEPGIMAAIPSDGGAGIQAVGQCPRGWLCAWPDIDYGGPMMAVQQPNYIDYRKWFYNGAGVIVMSNSWPGSGWRTFAFDITSVYNNTHTIAWAPLHNPVSGNYYAQLGHPIPYVGPDWNDWFMDACAC